MVRNPLQLIYGAATSLPQVLSLRDRIYGLTDPGTISARYSYAVWMRHLILAHRHLGRVPERVLEVGPGNSLGAGLAALLSGAEQYTALDLVPRVTRARNLRVFDELVALFERRTPVPRADEFPALHPHLDDNGFPHHVLPPEHLAGALAPTRLARLRRALEAWSPDDRDGPLRYVVRWHDGGGALFEGERVDLAFSHAALEHVDELALAYATLAAHLRADGAMSHQIDYRHHGTSLVWNGHWGYSDAEWRIVKGRRHYLINRAPHSEHVRHIRRVGFEIAAERRLFIPSGIRRHQLAGRFCDLSDEDLHCAGAHIVAMRGES